MRQRSLGNVSGTDLLLWLIGASVVLAVVYGAVGTLTEGQYTAETWVSYLVFGLAQGGVYALLALGYTLVYGTLLIVNFAHGEVFMGGALTAYFVADAFFDAGYFKGASINLRALTALGGVLLVGVVTSIIIAVILERIAYRPLRRAPRLFSLISAIGASYFLQYTFRGMYGSGVKTYPDVEMLKGQWSFLGLEVLKIQVIVIIVTLLTMVGFYWFVQLTKPGKAMCAVVEGKETVTSMGFDVDRVIVITFVIGAALAGVAGVLYALLFKQVQFTTGMVPGIKAVTAAVLGGFGNIPGAILGGLLLGIVESLGPSLFLEGLGLPAPNQLQDVIGFTLLVLALIFRPSGLLRERQTEQI